MDIYKFLEQDYKKEIGKQMAGDFDVTKELFKRLMKSESMFNGFSGGFGDGIFLEIPCYVMEEPKQPEIENVVFFGKQECQVYWTDGEMTTVVCGKKDTFSEETAILMAIAKRFMKGYTTVEKALKKAERLPSKGRLNKLMGK